MLNAIQALITHLRNRFISLELLFRQQPVVLFQFIACYVTGMSSLWAATTVVAVLFFAMLLTHALLVHFDVRARAAVLRNLRTYPGEITAYRLRDIFEPDELHAVSRMIFFPAERVGQTLGTFFPPKTKLNQALDEIRIYVRDPVPRPRFPLSPSRCD